MNLIRSRKCIKWNDKWNNKHIVSLTTIWKCSFRWDCEYRSVCYGFNVYIEISAVLAHTLFLSFDVVVVFFFIHLSIFRFNFICQICVVHYWMYGHEHLAAHTQSTTHIDRGLATVCFGKQTRQIQFSDGKSWEKRQRVNKKRTTQI